VYNFIKNYSIELIFVNLLNFVYGIDVDTVGRKYLVNTLYNLQLNHPIHVLMQLNFVVVSIPISPLSFCHSFTDNESLNPQ
jgi:hypothetical protein